MSIDVTSLYSSSFSCLLGMVEMFDGSKADFHGMLAQTNGHMRVSDFIHQAIIDVNEAGSEAAAACENIY